MIIKRINVNEIVFSEKDETENRDISIQSLMKSIQSEGLIHPITVEKIGDDKYELITGRRRLLAFKKLAEKDDKYKYITCQVYSNLLPVQKTLLKISENKEREDVSWAEKMRLIAQIKDYLKSGADKEKIDKKLEEAGISKAIFNRMSQLLEELDAMQKTDGISATVIRKMADVSPRLAVEALKKSKKENNPVVVQQPQQEEREKYGLSPLAEEFLLKNKQEGRYPIKLIEDMLCYLPFNIQNELINDYGYDFKKTLFGLEISPFFLCKIIDIENAMKTRDIKLLLPEDYSKLPPEEIKNIIITAFNQAIERHTVPDIAIKQQDINMMLQKIWSNRKYKLHEKVQVTFDIMAVCINYLHISLPALIKSADFLKADEKILEKISKLKEFGDVFKEVSSIPVVESAMKTETMLAKINALGRLSEEKNPVDVFLNSIIELDKKVFLMDRDVDQTAQKIAQTFKWWLNQASVTKKGKKKEKIMKVLGGLVLSLSKIYSGENEQGVFIENGKNNEDYNFEDDLFILKEEEKREEKQ